MPPNAQPERVVEDLFRAFRRGDLAGVLATLHEDVSLTYLGANPAPVKATLVGHDRARHFFEGIYRRLELAFFEAHEFVVSGDTVVAFGRETGVTKATGEPFRNEWVQKYLVRDGLIESMVEYNIEVPSKVDPGPRERDAASRRREAS